MKTIDMSPAMIGNIVRIDSPRIVGTHDYIQGELRYFTLNVEEILTLGGDIWRWKLVGITANIDGYQIELAGNEHLTLQEGTHA